VNIALRDDEHDRAVLIVPWRGVGFAAQRVVGHVLAHFNVGSSMSP
jgi:hypothetical protein